MEFTKKEREEINEAFFSLNRLVEHNHILEYGIDSAVKLAKKDKRGLHQSRAVVAKQFLYGFDNPDLKASSLFGLAEWAQKAIIAGAGLYEYHESYHNDRCLDNVRRGVKTFDAATSRCIDQILNR